MGGLSGWQRACGALPRPRCRPIYLRPAGRGPRKATSRRRCNPAALRRARRGNPEHRRPRLPPAMCWRLCGPPRRRCPARRRHLGARGRCCCWGLLGSCCCCWGAYRGCAPGCCCWLKGGGAPGRRPLPCQPREGGCVPFCAPSSRGAPRCGQASTALEGSAARWAARALRVPGARSRRPRTAEQGTSRRRGLGAPPSRLR